MKTTITILIIAIGLFFTSCINKTPLTEEQKVYVGNWLANDGTFVQIFEDGSGAFEEKNSNVSGGAVTFEGNEFEISLFGISNKYTIQEEPSQEGKMWKMKLNNKEYVKYEY